MSDGAWAALYVILGASLSPFIDVGTWAVRRRLERSDRARTELRESIFALHDALVEFTHAVVAYGQMRVEDPRERQEGKAKIDRARQLVSIHAARTCDEEILTIINNWYESAPNIDGVIARTRVLLAENR